MTNYKIYYTSTGNITGILNNDELVKKETYEQNIEYDIVNDFESDLEQEYIFFNCKIDITGPTLIDSISSEKQKAIDLNRTLSMRKIEYPDIGEQLDMLWHAIDTGTLDKTSDFYTVLKSVKDANPKPE